MHFTIQVQTPILKLKSISISKSRSNQTFPRLSSTLFLQALQDTPRSPKKIAYRCLAVGCSQARRLGLQHRWASECTRWFMSLVIVTAIGFRMLAGIGRGFSLCFERLGLSHGHGVGIQVSFVEGGHWEDRFAGALVIGIGCIL